MSVPKTFFIFLIFSYNCAYTNPIHLKIMYYTCFLIKFVIKKLFGDYIWDLKANKRVQRWAYWKVCCLIIHLRETVHFCGVIDRESVTVVGRTNWRLDNLSKSGKSSSENDQKRSETKIDIILTLDKKLQYSGQMTEKLRRLIFRDTV